MRKLILLFFLLFSSLFGLEIKDAYNELTLKEPAKRVVALDYVSVDVLIALGAYDKIVGITSDWKSYLGDEFKRYGYDFASLPNLGKAANVNYESIIALKPDVVIISKKYDESIKALKEMGLKVFVSSFKNNQRGNELELEEGIISLGKLVGKEAKSKELLSFIRKSKELLKPLDGVSLSEKPRVMILDKWLGTYGDENYVMDFFEKSGAFFITKNDFKGYKELSPEAILAYDPDYIFIQERYSDTKEILDGDVRLKELRAIKNNSLIVLPRFAKAWGHITPEAASIGEIYIAKFLHPKLFKDIDLDELVAEFESRFR